MTKETVFDLIRIEDAVLWVGAGLSIYAGYPSASTLSKSLVNVLDKKEKRSINRHASLQDLTEEIVRLKGGSKNFLMSELRKIYLKQPASITYHKILSQIPHIKTIITTNYDNLFELAYGDQIHKIVSDLDTAIIYDVESLANYYKSVIAEFTVHATAFVQDKRLTKNFVKII